MQFSAPPWEVRAQPVQRRHPESASLATCHEPAKPRKAAPALRALRDRESLVHRESAGPFP